MHVQKEKSDHYIEMLTLASFFVNRMTHSVCSVVLKVISEFDSISLTLLNT